MDTIIQKYFARLLFILCACIAYFLFAWGILRLCEQVRTFSILPLTPIAEASPIPVSRPQKPLIAPLSPEEVQSIVRRIALQHGVNPAIALFIIKNESGDCWREGFYDPAIEGHEPNGSTSYGCWQFNDRNADFDHDCATNFSCSTQLAMEWILAGRINRWSTWSERCTLYPAQFPPDC